jgi:pimeloyl-ACP methyl ester carboxylesterase
MTLRFKRKNMMNYEPVFSKKRLRSKPEVMLIKGWAVEYIAVCLPQNRNKTPLIMIPGAFQTFLSYCFSAEELSKTHPLIMIDLPSQGGNEQLADELSLDDMASLLNQFCLMSGVSKPNILGMSYGSLIAAKFAINHAENINRLIVIGIARKLNMEWWGMLERYLSSCDAGEFASFAIVTMINHNHDADVNINSIQYNLFLQHLLRISEIGKIRFAQNTNRLINVKPVRTYPQCPTLVATGEFDNFTLPYENAEFANKCSDAKMVIIRKADHLSVLERGSECCAMVSSFLEGEPLQSNADYELVPNDHLSCIDRRVGPRVSFTEGFSYTVETFQAQIFPAVLINSTFYGCRIRFGDDADSTLVDTEVKLYIKRKNVLLISLKIHIVEVEHNEYRGRYVHSDLKTARGFLKFLDEQESYLVNSIRFRPANP